jgi:hypothetical protein
MEKTMNSKANMPGLELVDSVTSHREASDYLFAVLVSTSVACFAAGNLLILSVDLVARTAPIFGVCLSLICVLYALARLLGGVLRGATLLLALVCLFVALREPWLNFVYFAGAAGAAVFTARQLRVRKEDLPLLFLLGALGASVAYSSRWLDSVFDMLGALQTGCPAKDTLYHAAIAAMIKNYGVVSTGLNGLVETPYYAMTHYLLAMVSRLSGRGVVEAIGVLNLTLLIPLLLFAVVYVVSVLAPGCTKDRLSRVWILACVSLVSLPWLLDRWHFSAFCFASESYVLSIALLLFALPTLFVRRLRWFDAAVIAALAVVLSYTKISTALFIPGMVFLRLALLRTETKVRDAILLLASGAIVFYFLFGVVKAAESGGSHGFGLSRVLETIPFGSAWTSVAQSWRGGGTWAVTSIFLAGLALLLYAFFHFIVSWCVLWVGVRQAGADALLRSPVGVFVAGSAVAGLVLSCTYFDYNNIGTYYFSHPAFFLALPFFCAWLAGLACLNVRAEFLAIGGGLLLCMLSLKSYYKYSRWAPFVVRDNLNVEVVDELMTLRTLSLSNVVFRAPASVSVLPLVRSRSTEPWLMPTAQPFLFPAVSERPWTGVTGPRGTNSSENYISYGYLVYDMDRESGQMLSQPVLLKGMSIREWEGGNAATPR